MVVSNLAFRILEGTVILCTRTACGDETALEVGEQMLTDDAQERIAGCHSHQVGSMMETRTGFDDECESAAGSTATGDRS